MKNIDFKQTAILSSMAILTIFSGYSLLSKITQAQAVGSCVVTLFGQQYDVTTLQSTHSGGNIFVCGTDMTTTYTNKHGVNVSRMTQYLIIPTTPTPTNTPSPTTIPTVSPTTTPVPSVSPSPTVIPVITATPTPSVNPKHDDDHDDDHDDQNELNDDDCIETDKIEQSHHSNETIDQEDRLLLGEIKKLSKINIETHELHDDD
jgi:hypothetical protein